MTRNDLDLELAFREHGAFLRRLALALCKDPWLADDLIQDTWLACAEHDRERPDSPRAWLGTVLRRVLGRRRRATERRERRERQGARPEASVAVEREELVRDLVEVTALLPAADRRLVLRHFWEGTSLREIARQDGVMASALSRQLRLALGELRRRLDQRHGGRRSWLPGLLLLSRRSLGSWSCSGVLAVAAKKSSLLMTLGLIFLLLAAVGLFISTGATEELGGSGGPPVAPGTGGARRNPIGTETVVANRTGMAPAVSEATGPVAGAAADFVTGELEVRLRQSSAGPAVAVRILATALDLEVGLIESSAVTDPTGRALFTRLAPGRHELVCARGGQTVVTVVAGRRTSLDWTLPRAPVLEGVVVDVGGRPIADAELHLALAVDPGHFVSAARCAADGRFRLEDVASAALVVSAPGHRPSRIIELADGGRDLLRVVLEPGGRRLELRLLDPSGTAVPDAWCRVVESSPTVPATAAGDHPGRFDRSARSDRDGRVLFEGLGDGPCTLTARAPGHGPVTGESISAASSSVTIELPRERLLVGEVVDRDDRPMAGLRIVAGPYRGAHRHRGLSDEAGRFVVHGLAPGNHRFEFDAGSRGRMTVDLAIGTGELTRHRLRFDAGPSIRGRLVDDRNDVLAGLRLRARPMDDGQVVTWLDALTDDNGRFTLESATKGPYRIEIYDPLAMEQPIFVLAGIRPGPEEQTLVIDRAEFADTFVLGRVVDDQGRPLPAAVVTLFPEGALVASSREVGTDGRFRYGPFGAGPLLMMVGAEGLPEVSRALRLERGRVLDLGDVVLPRPGRAVARILAPADGGAQVSGAVVSEDARSFSCRFEGGRCFSPLLAPGRYTFSASCAGGFEASKVIEVAAGADTEFDLRLERGADLRLAFVVPGGSVSPDWFRVLIERAAGEAVLDRRYDPAQGLDFGIVQSLPLGKYRVVIESATGFHRVTEVVISSTDQPETALLLELAER
ncbi:MAG: sigma-70 family RNA polymerase sigma factor [Planctomycetes bacterium]|nr:sigma-70 family RNA polymerase sigma factor [Planctomycetota bacterium]